MPTYTVIVTNRADLDNTQRTIGGCYIDTITAPDEATVALAAASEIAKSGADPALYTWTIEQTAP